MHIWRDRLPITTKRWLRKHFFSNLSTLHRYCGHLWSKTFSVPSFGYFWKTRLGDPVEQWTSVSFFPYNVFNSNGRGRWFLYHTLYTVYSMPESIVHNDSKESCGKLSRFKASGFMSSSSVSTSTYNFAGQPQKVQKQSILQKLILLPSRAHLR